MIPEDHSADAVLKQFMSAQNAEAVAIADLLSALNARLNDKAALMALTDRMTETHNKKMDIWNQVQRTPRFKVE